MDLSSPPAELGWRWLVALPFRPMLGPLFHGPGD